MNRMAQNFQESVFMIIEHSISGRREFGCQEPWYPLSTTHAQNIKTQYKKKQRRRKKQRKTKHKTSYTIPTISNFKFSNWYSRHKKIMYATDAKAQALCAKVLYHTYHKMISPLQAIFMPCLVLTHSEEYHHQVSEENSTAIVS